MLSHRLLVQSAFQLQALPPSIGRLTVVMAEEEPDLEEMAEIVSFDPVITAKLLRVANSSYSAPSQPITDVRMAILRLGPGLVVSLAVGACTRPLLEQRVPGYDLSPGALWRHCVMTALAAEVARDCCEVTLPPASFTAALLHDIGKLILGRFLTPETRTLLRRAVDEGGLAPYQAEAEVLSLHHGEVGGIIAQHWQMPDSIFKGITYHHQPEAGAELICHVTHLANQVATVIESKSPPVVLDKGLGMTLQTLGLAAEHFGSLCLRVAESYRAMSARYI